MKIKQRKSGFTLIELLVAMVVTLILLGVLTYMTRMAMETYKDSRNEVRASRQAKAALEVIAKDFESMISRRDGNTYEWLYAGVEDFDSLGPSGKNKIPNTCKLLFFTGATDRYNGDIGGLKDKGGDVSAVGYRLVYKDQILDNTGAHSVFSLYRRLVNPDDTFTNLLSVDDLNVSPFNKEGDLTAENFLVENIYEFTVTFLVEVTVPPASGVGASRTYLVRATMEPDGFTEFRLKGTGLDFIGNVNYPSGSGITDTQFKNGSIVGAEVSITVLTDRGMVLAKKSGISQEELISKHSYHYTKTINTPRP